MKRRALGRGLSELLSAARSKTTETATEIEVSRIQPNPYQPRAETGDEDVQELAESIRQHGILQPLVVRPLGGGNYQIIAGERRWRAAQLVGMERVPCVVREVTDADALGLALVENLQRADLDPIEAATGYRRLMDEFGMTQDQVAHVVGKSRAAVANTMRLLHLPEEVQQLIRTGALSEGHGRALLGLANAPEKLLDIAREAVQRSLSVRDVERIVQRLSSSRPKTSSTRASRARARLSPEMEAIRNELQQALATAVRIRPRGRGGVIEIEYYDEEDLTRILELLQR